MIELKFRAWDKISKYWYDDHPIIDFKNQSVIDRHDGAEGSTDRVAIVQFIGLKDRNDAEIYSDYLLNIHINRVDRGVEYDYIARVVWDDNDLCWGLQSEKHGNEHLSWVLDGFDGEYIEIVGNMFENQDLLGVQS